MFPSLLSGKPTDEKRLSCLQILCKEARPLEAKEISKLASLQPASTKKILEFLAGISLVEIQKREKTEYRLTAKGVIAVLSVMPSFSRVRPALLSLKNDELAFALLVIGHASPERKDDALNAALAGFAISDRTAESLLAHYSRQRKTQSTALAPYLGMFRDFTPAGFQDILQMLLVAIKPTPDDYNWLVQFFYELVEFYYNPIRLAYINMLSFDSELKSRLERYRKEQEALMKKQGTGIELTFRVLGGFELEKFASMPAHLKAMGLKLILEPLQFMTEELRHSFWDKQAQNP